MVLATLNLISVTVTKISQFIFCKRLSFYFQQFDTISKAFFRHKKGQCLLIACPYHICFLRDLQMSVYDTN